MMRQEVEAAHIQFSTFCVGFSSIVSSSRSIYLRGDVVHGDKCGYVLIAHREKLYMRRLLLGLAEGLDRKIESSIPDVNRSTSLAPVAVLFFANCKLPTASG
jgi:hypothetical protein